MAAMGLSFSAMSSEAYLKSFYWWSAVALCSAVFAATDDLYARAKIKWSDDLTPSLLRTEIEKAQFHYCLVLRPFASDARIKMENSLNPFAWIGIPFGMPFIDAQEWIVRRAPIDWRFFSWGGGTGPVRPDRVLSEEETWFQDLKEIARAVQAIIIIPGTSKWIKEEFEFLLRECIQQTIIFLPPVVENESYYRQFALPALFQDITSNIPKNGALILPYKGSGSNVMFAIRPLSRKSLAQVLKTKLTIS
jgi:hypothetical protein